jgi:hypothetical protein
MQVFLGDVITLIKGSKETATMITGQCSGIVLNDKKELDRVYVHGLETAFYMHQGWEFIDPEEEEDGSI